LSEIAFCQLMNFNEGGGVGSIHRPSDKELKNLLESPYVLFNGNFIGPPSGILFRRPARFLFNEKLKWLVDIDFYINNWVGNQFVFIPEVLISVYSGGSSQVTRECEHNLQINVYEYLTVFDGLKNRLSKKQYDQCIKTLKIIFSNLNVININQIRQAGYLGAIPKEISRFMQVIKLNQFLARCLARL